MIEDQEVSQEYTAGWSSNVETEYLGKGLSEETIRLISDKNDEPEWLLESSQQLSQPVGIPL